MKLAGSGIERGLAVLIGVGVFVLPIAFVPVLSDVFALPKTLLMLAISVALFLGLLVLASRGGARALMHMSSTAEALALRTCCSDAAAPVARWRSWG
jgi:hypothetical protein